MGLIVGHNLLAWLDHWYRAQCNGVWEHGHGVTIETLAPAGWHIRIDLAGTALAGQPFPPTDSGAGHEAQEWWYCHVQDNVFHGYGGPGQVEALLHVFQHWAGQPTVARLQMALLGLAAPVEQQRAVYPDFVDPAEELACDYHRWLALAQEQALLSVEQLRPLIALDKELTHLSNDTLSTFWTEEALRQDARWEHVRSLARAGLAAMNWSVAPPPPSPDLYIPTTPWP